MKYNLIILLSFLLLSSCSSHKDAKSTNICPNNNCQLSQKLLNIKNKESLTSHQICDLIPNTEVVLVGYKDGDFSMGTYSCVLGSDRIDFDTLSQMYNSKNNKKY